MNAETGGSPDAGSRSAGGPAAVYALLADGATVAIRAAAAGDFDAVLRMHRAMSPENMYLRFFSMSPAAGEGEASRICREAAPDHVALLAWLTGDLVGVASYETAGSSGTAEVAFAVADHVHHRGVATLLLEHLVSAGRSNGVRTFTAEVLAENFDMLKLFAAVGLHARRKQADGVTDLAFDLPGDDADPGWEPYLDAGGRPGRRGGPSACGRGGVGGRGRGEPAARVGRPGDPAQHRQRGLRRAGAPGGSARLRHRWRLVRARAGRAARPGGSRRAGGPGGRGAAGGGGMRRAGRRGAPGDRLRTGSRGHRRSARLLPPPRDAAGRPELPRHRRPGNPRGRDVRGPPAGGGLGRGGRPVRRGGHRAARPAVPPRNRDLLLRLPWRQGRRVRPRPAEVVREI